MKTVAKSLPQRASSPEKTSNHGLFRASEIIPTQSCPGVCSWFGTLFLRYISPFYLVMCIYQVYAGALRGAGNSRVPMILMLLSFVAFRQAYLYVFSRWMPGAILPIALSYPAGWLACSVSTLIYYSRAHLSKSRLVEDDPPAKTA